MFDLNETLPKINKEEQSNLDMQNTGIMFFIFINMKVNSSRMWGI